MNRIIVVIVRIIIIVVIWLPAQRRSIVCQVQGLYTGLPPLRRRCVRREPRIVHFQIIEVGPWIRVERLRRPRPPKLRRWRRRIVVPVGGVHGSRRREGVVEDDVDGLSVRNVRHTSDALEARPAQIRCRQWSNNDVFFCYSRRAHILTRFCNIFQRIEVGRSHQYPLQLDRPGSAPSSCRQPPCRHMIQRSNVILIKLCRNKNTTHLAPWPVLKDAEELLGYILSSLLTDLLLIGHLIVLEHRVCLALSRVVYIGVIKKILYT